MLHENGWFYKILRATIAIGFAIMAVPAAQSLPQKKVLPFELNQVTLLP